jgi:hypothetical protein
MREAQLMAPAPFNAVYRRANPFYESTNPGLGNTNVTACPLDTDAPTTAPNPEQISDTGQ